MCDNSKPVSAALFRASDSSRVNYVKAGVWREGWVRIFLLPPVLRNFLPHPLSLQHWWRAQHWVHSQLAALWVCFSFLKLFHVCRTMLFPQELLTEGSSLVLVPIPQRQLPLYCWSKGMLFKSGLKKCEVHTWWNLGEVPQLPGKQFSVTQEQLTPPTLAFISLALNQCPKDKPCSQDWDVDLSHFWEASPLWKQPVDYTWSIWCLSAMTEEVLLILWSQTLRGKLSVCYQEKLNAQTRMNLSLSAVTWAWYLDVDFPRF